MKVDSHIHLWNAEHTPQPWMTDEHASIARPFGPDDIVPLIERNGIDQVIVVQGACLDSDTDYLFEEAARCEWIGAITAWVRLDDAELAAGRLAELGARPKFRGVRHLTHNEPDHWIVRPEVLECVALLNDQGTILEMPVVFPRHFDDVLSLAERFPDLRIVIDHLGKPPISSPEMGPWSLALRAAAEHPNVFAKVSGLNTALDWADWTLEDLMPAVEVALECFGPERLMCGSDWPYSLLNGEYDRVWGGTAGALLMAASDHAELLLGENARRLYGLERPVGASLEGTTS
jgi:L-fuconolactonase